MPTTISTEEIFTEIQREVIGKFIKTLNEKYEEYDYIILTARRGFCFVNSLLAKGIELKQDKFISSQAIDFYGNDFRGKKILLCDDIMIHGQSIYSMYQKIKKYNPESVNILTMIRNIEKPDYFYFKSKVRYDVIINLDDEEWRKFSNNIVKFIHSESVLYISYVLGFGCSKQFVEQISNNTMLKNLSLEKDILVHDYYLNEEYEPIYFKLNSINNIFPLNNDFINFATIRVYKDPRAENSYWILPYVELKDIKSDALKRVFSSLSKIDERFKVIKHPCEQYKALTAIFSALLFYALDGKSYVHQITDYIDKSYFKGFVSLITERINKEEILDICNQEIGLIDIYVHDDPNPNGMVNVINEYFNNNVDCSLENFKKCFASLNLKEEDEFRVLFNRTEKEGFKVDYVEALKTIKPVRTSLYYKNFNDTLVSFENAIKYTLYFSDNGVVSFVVNEFVQDGEKFVGAYIKSGEQSYRMHADYARESFNAIYYLYDLLMYYNDFETRKNVAQNILQYMREHLSHSLDISKFEFFLRDHFSVLFYLPDYFFATSKDKSNVNKDEEKRILLQVKNALKEIK